MKLNLKYDIKAVCKKIVEEQLSKMELSYAEIGFGEVEVKEPVPAEKIIQLNTLLNNYGIEIDPLFPQETSAEKSTRRLQNQTQMEWRYQKY